MITFPNAKINLGLNIVEKRPDGYHNLETIFYPINLQDALEVTRRENNDKEYTLHISGSPLEGEPEDNLVVKAYKLLKKDYPGLLPVDIHPHFFGLQGVEMCQAVSDLCSFLLAIPLTIPVLNEMKK